VRAHLTAAAGVHGSRPSLVDIYLRLTDHDGHLFPVVIIAIFGALFRGAGGSSYFYGPSALHYYVPTIAAIPVPGSCYTQLAIVLLTWRQNGILKRAEGAYGARPRW
jgi:hypothetical protein